MNGTFSFRDGEGGVRSIELKILPHGEVEVTEKFIVMLSILSGEMGVDPKPDRSHSRYVLVLLSTESDDILNAKDKTVNTAMYHFRNGVQCVRSLDWKFGDPNGIVQFTEQDLKERIYSEPSDSEGPLKISLLITRREGVMGNITVGKRPLI